MPDAKQLRQQAADKLKTANAIVDGAKAGGRELTADEKTKVDTLLDEQETLLKDAEQADRDQQRELRLQHAAGRMTEVGTGIGTGVGGPTGPLARGDVRVGKTRSQDDPMCGFESPADFFLEVMNAGKNRVVSDRLKPLMAQGSDEQSGGSDPYGGFLLPREMSPNLLTLQGEGDWLAKYVTRIPTTAASIDLPARVDKNHSTSVTGGVIASRTPETQNGTATRSEVEQITYKPTTITVFTHATEQLIADSPISIPALIEQNFGEALGDLKMRERISGTGVGEPLGVLNSPSLVTVSKEAGQAADTIVYDNVLNMWSRCYRKEEAVWIANHDTIPQLGHLEKVVGTGGKPILVMNAAEKMPETLFGRPIIYTEYAKALGDKGDLILGSWRQYIEVVRQQALMASSVHVRFLASEQTFRMTMRDTGAPSWRSPLTPVNSSTTLSPFVVIEAR